MSVLDDIKSSEGEIPALENVEYLFIAIAPILWVID